MCKTPCARSVRLVVAEHGGTQCSPFSRTALLLLCTTPHCARDADVPRIFPAEFESPRMAAASIPSHARVVVIGGGIIGNSVAYHLAQHAGWGSDVVVLERDQLTSGTTWHAAGLMVTFGSLSETATEIRKYSKELYSTLEGETGQSTGFMPVGFIELATSTDRLEEYRRVSAFNRRCGVDVQEISPSEVQSLFPLCHVEDVEAGFYVPTDGRVNPVDCTMALSKGARQKGVRIYEGITVTDVQRQDGKVSGVAVRNAEGEMSTISAEVSLLLCRYISCESFSQFVF